MNKIANKKYIDNLTLSSKVRRLMWWLVYTLFFKYTPRLFFHKWRILVLRVFGASIGNNCKIDPTCKIWAPWNLILGDFVCIAGGTDLYTVDKIKIGSNVTISQRAFLCTASHDISFLNKPLVHREIIINDYAWVCAESFISSGVVINEGSVVAARGVVTKDIKSWVVVGGNPAKFIKNRTINK